LEERMSGTKLNLGNVRIALTGPGWPPQRAQAVTRLAFRHVQELMTRAAPGGTRAIAHLSPPPVKIAAGASDAEIARQVGAALYRSLQKA
jgi:hypothetical protein